jgi:hypothetical protein
MSPKFITERKRQLQAYSEWTPRSEASFLGVLVSCVLEERAVPCILVKNMKISLTPT